MIVLRGVNLHLFYYAKGRYKRSGDIFYDLTKIIKQTTDNEKPSFNNLFEKVFDLFRDLLNLDQQRDFWLDAISKKTFLAIDGKYKIDLGDIIKHMLHYLSLVKLDDVDGNVLVLLSEEPDYSIFA